MAGWNDDRFAKSQDHASTTHDRWGKKPELWTAAYWHSIHAHPDDADDTSRDENQCGGCAYYLSVEGRLGSDWGVCTNAASKSDGRVRFEHDGCAEFES